MREEDKEKRRRKKRSEDLIDKVFHYVWQQKTQSTSYSFSLSRRCTSVCQQFSPSLPFEATSLLLVKQLDSFREAVAEVINLQVSVHIVTAALQPSPAPEPSLLPDSGHRRYHRHLRHASAHGDDGHAAAHTSPLPVVVAVPTAAWPARRIPSPARACDRARRHSDACVRCGVCRAFKRE